MSYSNLIGSLAAALTTLAFVPQVYRSYKTRDLSGISLPMYSIFIAGVGLWLDFSLIFNQTYFCYYTVGKAETAFYQQMQRLH